MAVNFYTDFSQFALFPSMRADVSFRYFFDIKKANVWGNSEIELSQILSPIKSEKIKKGELEDFERLVDLSNIVRRYNQLEQVSEVSVIGSDKIIIGSGDIVIPKIQPRMGNIFMNIGHERYICSTELVEYSCNPSFNPKLLFYILTHPRFSECLFYSESGKTHRRVNASELLRYKIPFIDYNKQNKIINKIEVLEEQIILLQKQIINDDDIINRVFISEFNWDIDRFNLLKQDKSFQMDFYRISNNYDLRFSPKFHRPAGAFVNADILKNNCLRVKDFLAEPIVLGATMSSSDFDSSGDTYYLSMASVKNYKVELDDSQLLSDSYCSQPKVAKKRVKKDDIIMTRSGAAIGKFALVEEDINAIHSDFTMRIRLQNINLYFAYYYFRSVYFQYLIEINYKGLQNNNIFPKQVQEFPMPDISKERQDEIVEKIKSQLDTQRLVNDKIVELRNQIDDILEVELTN